MTTQIVTKLEKSNYDTTKIITKLKTKILWPNSKLKLGQNLKNYTFQFMKKTTYEGPFSNNILTTWQPMRCSLGSVLRLSRCFFNVTCDIKHITHDNVTHDIIRMSCDTWHKTLRGWWKLSQNVISLALTVWEFW